MPYSSLPNDGLRDLYASHVKYVDVASLKMELTWKITSRSTIKIPLEGNGTTVKGKKASVHTLPEADDENGEYGLDCLTNLRLTVSRVVLCWNYCF